jgi:uncharacterized protein YjiS (DUF1127 family)
MAQAIKTISHDFPLASTFSRLVALVQLWRRRVEERDQLARFTARDLHDIGLTCADKFQLLDKPFWR